MRGERLRRVLILCVHFARNLGYLRGAERVPAGWKELPLHESVNFCRIAYNNSLDICVLEWCKLFGDDKAKLKSWDEHYWGKIVSDPAKFESELLQHLNISASAFDIYRIEMRTYRDKFLAHLDSERTMKPPVLELARQCVDFYYDYVVTNEAQPGDLFGLPVNVTNLRRGYDECKQEAARAYAKLAANP